MQVLRTRDTCAVRGGRCTDCSRSTSQARDQDMTALEPYAVVVRLKIERSRGQQKRKWKD